MIDITPFDPERCGPNSYDLTLSDQILEYTYPVQMLYDFAANLMRPPPLLLDMKTDTPVYRYTIRPEGLVLQPGILYLGSTVERTACAGVVPHIDGRSSVGRLGLFLHVTAGRGDDGFGLGTPEGCTWTLEMCVVQPLRIYAGVRVAQIAFHQLIGERAPYSGKYVSHNGPTPSGMWRDFLPEQEPK